MSYNIKLPAMYDVHESLIVHKCNVSLVVILIPILHALAKAEDIKNDQTDANSGCFH